MRYRSNCSNIWSAKNRSSLTNCGGVRGAVDDRVLNTSDVACYVTNIEMLQDDAQLRRDLGGKDEAL